MKRSAALLATMLVAGTLAACNALLGIQEQDARPVPDDAGEAEAEASVRPSFEACTRDVDCVAPNGCYTPHCDTVLGACTYALCETKERTCARGVCDTSTFVCSDALPHGFLATSYDVRNVTSGCGPKPETCVAAAYPFVFIGTQTDVVAVRGDDLGGKTAAKVPVTGVTVKPQQVIASGRRIWVLGAVQGAVPPYQLPITSIDVPSDPTVLEIHAQTTVVGYSFPSAVGFPAPNGGLFVVYDDAAQGTPTALIAPPIPDGTTLGLASAADAGPIEAGVPTVRGSINMIRTSGVPAGAVVAASSGNRIVLWRYPSTFNLVAAAGTPMAAVQGDLVLSAQFASIYGPTLTSFAEGPDGTVMIAGPVAADSPADCNCTTHARLQWVFPNAIATTTDVNQILDTEAWVNPGPPPMTPMCRALCNPNYEARRYLATWVDRRTALMAAPVSAALGARDLTDVRMVGRDPFEANAKRHYSTKPTDMPKGELGVDRIALTSSNGLGYLVLADGQGNNITMSIMDPACDAVAPNP